MKKILLTSLVALALGAASASAQLSLIAGWDFSTTTNGGTALSAAPNTPTTILAGFGEQAGTAAIYANGTANSSTWTTSTTGNEITTFGGTSVNAGTGFDTSTGSALALLNSSANGKSIVFAFSMTGYESLEFSYAARNTSTGFQTQTWAYSIDGVNYTDFDTVTGLSTSFSSIALTAVPSLDGQATAYLRATFTGASSAAGNNRLDNIQISAVSAVPEPSTYALLAGVGIIGFVAYRRRKAAAQA